MKSKAERNKQFLENVKKDINSSNTDNKYRQVGSEKGMYKFGQRSLDNLNTCHPLIQEILHEAIKITDFSVIKGYRGEEEQNKAFADGASKLKYPNSKHNTKPSLAVDIAPFPIDWNDIERFAYLAGIIRGIAHEKGIRIRQGCDWGMDGNIRSPDQRFYDWPHFELVDVD